MVAGFTNLVIKDGNGASQNIRCYADVSGNLYPAPTGTDALGDILGLSTTPVYSQIITNIVTYNSVGFARSANTTPYVAGQLVANSTVVGSVVVPSITAAYANNIGGFITAIQLLKTSNSLTNAIFRIHFYNILPTVTNGDGAAWLSPKAGYIGNFDVTMTQGFSDPAAAGLGIPLIGSGLPFTPVSGAQTLYYLIEARAAYTPVSAETFSLNIWVN